MDALEARVEVLERQVVRIARTTSEPVAALLDWLGAEQMNDLGRTRGRLAALEAFARAAIAAMPDRTAINAALTSALAQAEADLLMLTLPDAAMMAATEGMAATAGMLQRALKG